MSVVCTVHIIFEEPNLEGREEIISYLESQIPIFIESDWGAGPGEGEVIIQEAYISPDQRDTLFALELFGGDQGHFFDFIEEGLSKTIKSSYYATVFFEPSDIYVSIRKGKTSVSSKLLEFSDDEELFSILESDTYIEKIRRYCIYNNIVERKRTSIESTDELIETLIKLAYVHDIDWKKIPFDIVNGLTRNGETIVTAIIKECPPSDVNEIGFYNGYTKREAIMEGLLDIDHVNFLLQNKHFETPFILSQFSDSEFIRGVFDDFNQTNTMSFEEMVKRIKSRENFLGEESIYTFKPELSIIVNQTKDVLKEMYFNTLESNGYCLEFSSKEKCIRGEHTVRLDCHYIAGKFTHYTLFIQVVGDSKSVFNKQFTIDEAEDVVEHIRRYSQFN